MRGLALSVIAAGVLASPARSQLLEDFVPTNLSGADIDPGVTVRSRLRPEYDAPGVRLGSVTTRAELVELFGYDDNVLGTSRGPGSLVIRTRAAVQAATSWTRNNLALGASVDDNRFLNLPQQSYTNARAGGEWSYDFGQDRLTASYQHLEQNQLPNSVSTIALLRPLPYRTDEARVSYRALLGRWILEPSFTADFIRFGRGSNLNGTTQDNRLLDRNTQTATLGAAYEFAPQRSGVLVVSATSAQYKRGRARPDFYDLSVLGGLDYNTTGVLRYRLLIGYQVREFVNAAFQSRTAPVAEGTVVWTPTGLTTVTASVLRRIEEANEFVDVGYTLTRGRIIVDHEYLRNVLLQGRASVEQADYQQDGSRSLFSAGASATWLLNRNMRLSLSYDFAYSPEEIRTYTRNVTLLQLRLAL